MKASSHPTTAPFIRLPEPEENLYSPLRDWLDREQSEANSGSLRDVRRLLDQIRRYLGMDVAIVSEFVQNEQVFQLVEGDGASFGVHRGDGLDLSETYCQRVMDGRLSEVVVDAKNDEQVRNLEATLAADIGSYVGIPLVMSDGTVYGMMCCLSHRADPSLAEVDIGVVKLLAQLISDQIERQQLESSNWQLRLEVVAVRALLAALEARDGYTGKHSEAVVKLSGSVAREMGLDDRSRIGAQQVAILHDVGKIGVADAILRKRGPLEPHEWVMMREHPVVGARIVERLHSLRHLSRAIRAEHERWDGNGYPDGLREEDIPLPSRIVLACDAYHAMVSNRPYRAAIRESAALQELRFGAGSQFCPHVAEALLSVLGGQDLGGSDLGT
jgi:HD-GYP domain-containing protein (c-di-GMP phosphodiesterase class II)